ncbi:hypothetical protein ACFWYW_48480 [Nonomuraea sp. NPDC059023]|uniref:hypothetical protein n=1 Tax=unclassified Nonomuraea TaxID=2593643 RepID=UPI003695E8B3
MAQVALGGGIVQAVMAITRRRQSLRQLDRETDSVAVETADKVVTMLRTELDTAKAEIAELRQERADQQRQIAQLAEQVSVLRAELAVAKAEISRLSNP